MNQNERTVAPFPDVQMAHNNGARMAFLMKAATVFTLLLGLGIAGWMLYEAIQHPEIQAKQGNSTAPLWGPMIAFVVVCAGGAAYVFWRAARRLDEGEDLVARRHRRNPFRPS